MTPARNDTLVVPTELAGERLDRGLATLCDRLSRAQARKLIDGGQVTVNGQTEKASWSLSAGDVISVDYAALPKGPSVEAEDIPLDVRYEDDAILVIDKPAGLVVHPSPGHDSGTLVNALAHHTGGAIDGGDAERPGIVHRLDRFTSGLMVVAKTAEAHAGLAPQFAAHTIDREYRALVWGTFHEDRGTIDAPIGRSPIDRKRMSVTGVNSRPSITHFTVAAAFPSASELAVRLETGRTHQVRVHCRYIDHPVIGDPMYGHIPPRKEVAWPDALWERMQTLSGQLLHATVLGLDHPITGERLRWECEPRKEYRHFRAALAALPLG